jgi:4-hydroxybenzoate polyprenyltransferase
MTALQFAIGSANDAADAERDAGRADKPIAGGLMTRRGAVIASIAFAVTGLVLSAPSGPPTLALAALGLAVGLAYDLRFRGTPASWMPFALGLPLLPVYAWVGATGALPVEFVVLVPCAVLAGIGIAIANALADVERDALAGMDSVARRLGPERAWRIHAAVLAAMSAGALSSLVALGGVGEGGLHAGVVLAGLGVAIVVLGIWLAGRRATVERGWEVEAGGMVLLAVGWFAAVGPGR